MEIKVKKTTATAAETSSTISLTAGLKLTAEAKARVKQDVGDYLVESILSRVGKAESPIDNGEWETQLSPAYKAKKKAEGLPGKANMEFEGDMLDALTYKETADGIKVGWFDKTEAPKADGHNNFSGKSNLPRRQSLPEEGQEFVSAIQREAEKIISDALADAVEFDAADFDSVNSTSELYDVLAEYFPDFTRSAIRAQVARTPKLVRLLDDAGLFELL